MFRIPPFTLNIHPLFTVICHQAIPDEEKDEFFDAQSSIDEESDIRRPPSQHQAEQLRNQGGVPQLPPFHGGNEPTGTEGHGGIPDGQCQQYLEQQQQQGMHLPQRGGHQQPGQQPQILV